MVPDRPIVTSLSASLISLPPYASTSSAVITPNRKRPTTAAAIRWLLSMLPSVRIGARVSMIPNRNRMTMAPM